MFEQPTSLSFFTTAVCCRLCAFLCQAATEPFCSVPCCVVLLNEAPTVSVVSARSCIREATTLHDAEELLLVDLAITITVGLVNHLLELLVGHVLTELLRDTLEVLEGDLAGLIVVEETEHLDDLLAGVAVTHASGHHVEELVEVDGAGAISVEEVESLTDLLDLVVGETLGLGWSTARHLV